MRIRERSENRLVLRESGLPTRSWGFFATILAAGASIAIYFDGDPVPTPAIILLAVFLVAGIAIAIFSRYRLIHVLDQGRNEGRIEYPTLMGFGREVTTFRLSDVCSVKPTHLSAFHAAVTRQENNAVSYKPQGGFSYLLADGTELEAGEFTTAKRETVAQVEAVSEFLKIPIEAPPE